MVSVDTESDPFINNGDEPCPKCAAPSVSADRKERT
jgi:ribosomal protein S27AE